MSSLFDEHFLANLQHSSEEPPPPEDHDDPEGQAREPIPDDLFQGAFDVPPARDAYHRDGAPRTVVDPAALLDGLNDQQRAAVVHTGSPLL